jgi:hypothetical protein
MSFNSVTNVGHVRSSINSNPKRSRRDAGRRVTFLPKNNDLKQDRSVKRFMQFNLNPSMAL